MLARFERIGIGANRRFDAASVSAGDRQAINAGVASALARIKAQATQIGRQQNGWNLTPRIFGARDQMQGQCLVRAAAARQDNLLTTRLRQSAAGSGLEAGR